MQNKRPRILNHADVKKVVKYEVAGISMDCSLREKNAPFVKELKWTVEMIHFTSLLLRLKSASNQIFPFWAIHTTFAVNVPDREERMGSGGATWRN